MGRNRETVRRCVCRDRRQPRSAPLGGGMNQKHPRRNTKAARFVQLPMVLLDSEAVSTLGHAPFRVMVCLAANYNGKNNGNLGLTASQVADKGISKNTFYSAVAELERRGVIERTYAASRVPPRPTKYALCWLPIDDTEYSRTTRLPSHAYKSFSAPPRKKRRSRAMLRAVR